MFTSYVLMIVIDPTGQSAVGLMKKKGPDFLIGKMTFPGGKMEAGETPEVAASREMREETGIYVHESEWARVLFWGNDEYEVHALAARSPAVLHARQMEEEPVFLMHLDSHSLRAAEDPERYSHDFLQVLTAAKTALHIA